MQLGKAKDVRGLCPVCGQLWHVRNDWLLRNHRNHRNGAKRCSGSEHTPVTPWMRIRTDNLLGVVRHLQGEQ